MTWGLVGAAGVGLVGGMMSSKSAKDSAEKQAQMSSDQAYALQQAAKWKATGTTNRYGSSVQTLDPETGDLTEASWKMSPEMKAYQDRLMAGSGQALPADFDVTKATEAQYQLLKSQQAPGVERGYSGLLSNLMGKGTLGLATGATEGIGGGPALAQTNPQIEAYLNAVAQQDAANLTNAQGQARYMLDSDINRSNGLFGQSNVVDAQGNAYLDKALGWSADQRDAALRGAGSVAQQSNLTAQQTANASSGNMMGTFLQGLSSNPQLGSSIGGFFNTTANPTVSPTASSGTGLKAPSSGSFW